MQRVRLNFMPQRCWACLRELTGREEVAVTGTDTADAIRLVDGVLVQAFEGALEPGAAAQLTAADRDRLLLAIYTAAYGPRIVGTLRCLHCGKLFDIDFALQELAAYVWKNGEQPASEGQDLPARQLTDGFYGLADGTQFRLPTGKDECAVIGLPPDEAEQALLAGCLVDSRPSSDARDDRRDAVQAAMASLAPILDLDLDAACSECGTPQPLHFDMQHYLLGSLLQERARLEQEIHRLASTYGWRLNEILSLPRIQRRSLVALIEAEHLVRGRIWT